MYTADFPSELIASLINVPAFAYGVAWGTPVPFRKQWVVPHNLTYPAVWDAEM